MAVFSDLDDAGFDGEDWDEQGVGLHASASFTGTGAVPRSGVIQRAGNPLGYVLKTGLTGTLKAGTCLVPGSGATRGAYPVVVPADVDLIHPAASGTNPRKDLIIAEVLGLGSATSVRRVRIVQGVAASSPANPTTNWAAPISGSPGDSGVSVGNGGWISLASVLIPTSASTLSTITDTRQWVAGPGGLLRGATRRWSYTKPNDGNVSANTYGQASSLTVASGEALPGIYQYTFVTQVLTLGTLGAGACAVRYRFTTPDGTTQEMARSVGYAESDLEVYSGIYVHEPAPSASSTSLTFTGEARTSPGNGSAQILTIKGTDSGFPSSVVVTRITDF